MHEYDINSLVGFPNNSFLKVSESSDILYSQVFYFTINIVRKNGVKSKYNLNKWKSYSRLWLDWQHKSTPEFPA